VRQVSDAQGP